MARKFTSLYKDDPIAEELAAGIQGTDVYQGSQYNLSDVPEFEGIKTASTDYNRIQDLYNLYMGGGFDQSIPIQASDVSIPLPGGGGSGGGGEVSATTPDTMLTDFEQNLIDQGAGVQGAPGDPIVAPGEMPVTQEEMDAFNQRPVTPVNEFPTGDASLAEQIAADDRAAKVLANQQTADAREQYAAEGQYPTPTVFDKTATLEDAGAGIDDMYGTDYQGEQPQDTSIIMQNIGEGITEDDIESIPITIDAAPKIMDTPGVTTVEPFSELDDLEADPGAQPIEGLDTGPSLIDISKDKINEIGQSIAALPGNVYDAVSQTVDIAGKKINLGSVAAKAVLNKVVGAPVSLIIDALSAIAPQRDPRQNALDDLYDVKDGTIQSGLMQGYNPVSGGGLYTLTGGKAGTPPTYGLQDAYDKRINTINETLARQEADPDKTQSQELINRRNALIEAKEKERLALRGPESLLSGDIDDDPTGDAEIAEIIAQQNRNEIQPTDPTLDIFDRGRGEIDVAPIDDEDDFEVSGDIAPGGMDQVLGKPVDTSPPTGTDRPGGDRRDDSPSDIPDRGRGQTPSKAPSAPTGISGPPSRGGSSGGPPSQGGGNQGGGSRKIVCTMMNESYGFGSFRNKIWLKHSKDLAPEYQRGYHKIFLPLVKLSKKNKLLKKTLEHIAVHRTIDIRQEARGKKHLLGRVYRKILEPICYVVGKYAKR